MKIAIIKAKTRLSELVDTALNGEQVLLTKNGKPIAEIKPIRAKKKPIDKLTALQKIARQAQAKYTPGPDAANSSNFLYDDQGIPS